MSYEDRICKYKSNSSLWMQSDFRRIAVPASDCLLIEVTVVFGKKHALTQIVSIALIICLVSALGFYLIQGTVELEKERIRQTNFEMADAISVYLENFISRSQLLFSSLAALDPIMRNDAEATKEILKTFYRTYPGYHDIFITNREGDVVISQRLAKDRRVNMADRDYFIEVMQTGRPAVSKKMLGRISGELVIVVAVPIFDQPEGSPSRQIIGSLNASISLQDLTRQLSSVKVGSQGYITILDKTGHVIVTTGPTDWPEDLSGYPHVQALLAGEAGTVEYENQSDHRIYLCSYKPVPNTTLGVLVSQPASEVYYSAHRRFTINSFILFLLVLVIIAFIEKIRRNDERRREDQVRQAEKLAAVGELAAGMAHEIRNPLTAARGFIQLLEKRFSDDLMEKEYLQIIIAEIDRVNKIITDFLLLAKPQAPHLQQVNVNKLLWEVSLLLENEALMRGCTVEQVLDENLPEITVDPSHIRQVFFNIIKNAFEAMGEDGRLTIKTKHHFLSNLIEISFTDTGAGIPKVLLKKIFDPFFTTKETGTGLGLTISSRIIDNYGGWIDINSEMGRGSTVTVWLPVDRERRNLFMEEKL